MTTSRTRARSRPRTCWPPIPTSTWSLGLNDSMALGAYNVIKDKAQYKNVYVAASADGQKEALALIKEGGCNGKYISTGLNSPSLAAEEAL